MKIQKFSSFKLKINSTLTETQLYGVYCLTVLFISGTFIGLYDLGWKVIVPLFLFFCFLGFFHFSLEDRSSIPQTVFFGLDATPTSFFYANNLLGILAVSPVVIYLILTWDQEFPFVGDHDFHLVEDLKASLFWINFKWQLLFFCYPLYYHFV